MANGYVPFFPYTHDNNASVVRHDAECFVNLSPALSGFLSDSTSGDNLSFRYIFIFEIKYICFDPVNLNAERQSGIIYL